MAVVLNVKVTDVFVYAYFGLSRVFAWNSEFSENHFTVDVSYPRFFGTVFVVQTF